MATQVEALVGICLNKLATLVEEKVVMILGVKDELKRLQRRMERIKGVHNDAERGRIQDSAINSLLNELKDIVYDADDIIDLCQYEGGKPLHEQLLSSTNVLVRCYFPLFSCFRSIRLRHEVADQIKALNNRLDEIYKDATLTLALSHIRSSGDAATKPSPRRTYLGDVVGREIKDATEQLVDMIVKDNRQNSVLAIVGMGGIGKTTLAHEVYNNLRIRDNFQIRIWVCVSQKFSEVQLVKEIIRKAGGNYKKAESIDELLTILANVAAGKSFFLVLDDLWESDVWTELLRYLLQNGVARVCNLVTTRNKNIADRIGAKHIHQVQKLQVDSGWELLCKRAYLDREEEVRTLRDVGVRIVEKCDGLPLAINVVAGLLTSKRSRREWEKVLHSNIWSMSELPEKFRGALYLSYEDLPPHLKQCFLYLSLFPENFLHSRWGLCRLWVAEGFVIPKNGMILEEGAEEYYYELLDRSLLQPDPMYMDMSTCRVHSLLWSLAQYLSQGESFFGDPQSLNDMAMSKLRRLSIAERGEMDLIYGGRTECLRLRSLLLITRSLRVQIHLFPMLPYLRVLYLNHTEIESIPDSIGNLIHLRMLHLVHTGISKVPESIGSLMNLQILVLQHCKFLRTLPSGVTRLSNLRCLCISYTPISCVPAGIGRLELLNSLEGFVTASDRQCNDLQDGWDLEELESLSELRRLEISKLERAKSDALLVKKKQYLKRLVLSCTPEIERDGQLPYTEEEINKIERIFNKLCPPPNLQELRFDYFYGRQFPGWMLSSSLGTYLPYLTYLRIVGCPACSRLPPLGQLPNLRYFQISGAFAIIEIGPEFLGNGVNEGLQVAAAFPKLEFLLLVKMPNWEEWSLAMDRKQSSDVNSLLLMPRLKELQIIDCPKLRALPEGLRQLKTLKLLKVCGAHSLTAFEGFPFLTEHLAIFDNRSLERVLNFPALRKLTICDNLAMKSVDNMVALQYLELQDYSMECLPGWLRGLLQKREHLLDDDLQLTMRCSASLIQRCLEGGPDWPIIQYFSRVSAHTEDKRAYLEYTKQNGYYRANP